MLLVLLPFIQSFGGFMSLRINHNTSSLNAHRNLIKADKRVNSSLEKLSSGLAINRAGDAPAMLVASEQMRSQVASLEQAIKNSETSVSMVQTSESALGEVNNMLVEMRSLAIHAANEGANDAVMLEADQQDISSKISYIDRIATTTQFGSKKLLDGSNGVSGAAIGDGLEFVSATTATHSSDEQGFSVTITQEAKASSMVASTALTDELIKNGEILLISEGGKTASYTTKKEDTVASAVRNFAAAAKQAGLLVNIDVDDSGIIGINHLEKGKDQYFEVSSSTAGVLSELANGLNRVQTGQDIVGMINGEAALGKGTTLSGIVGNPMTDGLVVRFNGLSNGEAVPEASSVGKVLVSQNSLTFQIGGGAGQKVQIALQNLASNQLGRGVVNRSNFMSLRDINVKTAQGSQDALALIDKAINDVTSARSALGNVQKNTLETNIATLQATVENMIAAESTIRDTDVAMEMANFTRNSLMAQSAAAMMAQANQVPNKVFRLIEK